MLEGARAEDGSGGRGNWRASEGSIERMSG
jgi:hypothetical protein